MKKILAAVLFAVAVPTYAAPPKSSTSAPSSAPVACTRLEKDKASASKRAARLTSERNALSKELEGMKPGALRDYAAGKLEKLTKSLQRAQEREDAFIDALAACGAKQ